MKPTEKFALVHPVWKLVCQLGCVRDQGEKCYKFNAPNRWPLIHRSISTTMQKTKTIQDVGLFEHFFMEMTTKTAKVQPCYVFHSQNFPFSPVLLIKRFVVLHNQIPIKPTFQNIIHAIYAYFLLSNDY